MIGYRYKIEDNRLYLYCVCDSTLFFLNCMKTLLENNGFTDIKCGGHRLEKGDKKIPEDKPFCDFEFECSGIFPNDEMRNKFTDMEGVL